MIAYAVVALFCGFIGFIAYTKSQASAKMVDKKPEPRIQGESPAQIARRLMNARRAPAPKVADREPAPRGPAVLVASVDEPAALGWDGRGQRGASPAAALGGESSGDEDRKERLPALRRALSGSTAVQLERVQLERANLTTPDPTATYQQAMNAAMAAAQTQAASSGGMPLSAAGMPAPPLPAASTGVGAFNRPGGADRFRLAAALERPRSRYILQPGRGGVIPAVLDSAVNSELPGPILGHVAVDVYDSPTGRYLLIPQGSSLFGEYAAGVVFGQSRLMVAWQRITLPDGRTLDIGEMPGTDGVGRAGFNDQVDNHYFRMIASALLMSGVTAGVAMSQEAGNGNGQSQRMTAGAAMSQALGQQLGQTTSMLLQKNMNSSPTLDIRPGYRFNIVVTKDLVFPSSYPR
jgi:type IV secretion system protein VirB10